MGGHRHSSAGETEAARGASRRPPRESGAGAALGRTVRRGLWVALAALAAAAHAPAQEAGAARVTLALAGGKQVFRAGEPVRLVMSFTSERAGHQLNVTTTKPPSSVDSVALAPEAGAHAWAEEYTGRAGYQPDHGTFQELTAKPVEVGLALNEWYRFDRPGRYTVRVTTSRVHGPGRGIGDGAQLRLTTNEVSFEVVEMSEAEEAAEVKRLSALLDAAKGWQEEARLAEELAYLSGEPSTREKVRRHLAGGKSGNYAQNIYLGLISARDRALVVRLLEAAVRDPETAPTHGLLHAASALRLMLEGVPRPAMSHVVAPSAHPRADAVLREYVAELVASLPKRKGQSRRAAAMTVLTNLPREGDGAQLPAAARDVLVGDFDAFHPFEQEYLLRVFWEQLRDPSLLPAVERMLAANPGAKNDQVRTAALSRLAELRPERAKPYVVAELRDPSSIVAYEVLAALPDETLPEADDALLEQVRAFAPLRQNYDSVMLYHKAMLVARYASPAVYDGLMEVYRAWGAKWQPDARAALLGYFARYNETQAAPLIEQALARAGQGQDLSFLLELTRVSYPGAVREMLLRRLEGEAPAAVGAVAYVMSQRGAAGDREAVEARLARWRKEWGGRAAELDAAAGVEQRMVEVNIVEALLRAKVWKLTGEQAARVAQGCVTEECRRRFGAK